MGELHEVRLPWCEPGARPGIVSRIVRFATSLQASGDDHLALLASTSPPSVKIQPQATCSGGTNKDALGIANSGGLGIRGSTLSMLGRLRLIEVRAAGVIVSIPYFVSAGVNEEVRTCDVHWYNLQKACTPFSSPGLHALFLQGQPVCRDPAAGSFERWDQQSLAVGCPLADTCHLSPHTELSCSPPNGYALVTGTLRCA